MSTEQLLEQIDGWHQAGEHLKIVDTILALTEAEREDEVLGQLAVAYNNLDNYAAAIAVLEQLRPRQENTDKWQYRMGYALYYIDRNEEAKAAFSRCLMLNAAGKYTEDCYQFLGWIEEELAAEKEDKEYGPRRFTLRSSEKQWDTVESHIKKSHGDY